VGHVLENLAETAAMSAVPTPRPRGIAAPITDAERNAICQRYLKGATLLDISVAVGRSYNAVRCCVQGVRRSPCTTESVRPCLCCQKEFVSAGPHHRLCTTCRKISTSPFDL